MSSTEFTLVISPHIRGANLMGLLGQLQCLLRDEEGNPILDNHLVVYPPEIPAHRLWDTGITIYLMVTFCPTTQIPPK